MNGRAGGGMAPITLYLPYSGGWLHGQVAAALVKVKCKVKKEKCHHSPIDFWAAQ